MTQKRLHAIISLWTFWNSKIYFQYNRKKTAC